MQDKKATILLAEDDHTLSILIRDLLTRQGFEVLACPDGKEALETFQEHPVDLCLLDIMMPGMDGINLAKEIRKQDQEILIFFLTAKNQPESVIKGFNVGGDEYLTKPFNMEELLVRIHALLRRGKKVEYKESISEKIRVNNMEFDPSTLLLTIEKNKRRLTFREAELLQFLLQNKNQLVKRETLLKEVWGDDDYFMGRSMDVFISRLRKYLKDEPSVCISNHHGVGFVLEVN